VNVTGDPAWNYHWGGSGSVLNNAQHNNVVNPDLPLNDEINYTLIVTNQFFCTSSAQIPLEKIGNPAPDVRAQLSLNLPDPVITLCQGTSGSASFFVAFPAATNLTNSWEVHDDAGALVHIPVLGYNEQLNWVSIFWDDSLVNEGNYFVVLNQQTSASSARVCIGKDSIQVHIQATSAPKMTEIQLFETPINVFIAEADGLCYQWGKTKIISVTADWAGNEIQGETYSIYPIGSAYDATSYYYWVDTWYPTNSDCGDWDDKRECATRSYYTQPDFTSETTEETVEKPAVVVFPNPGSGDFTVLLRRMPAGEAQFRLFDFGGRLLTQQSLQVSYDDQMTQFSLADRPSGHYYLQIISAKGTVITQPVILQRP
jgi:hypothetical protein